MGPECVYRKLISTFPDEFVQVEWVRWMSATDECRWAGVFCDDFNQTRAIELDAQEIRGEFPFALIHLPFLQSIRLVRNELYGTIPSEVSQMNELANLELHYNYFSGPIPSELFDMLALSRLNLGDNQLTSTIPTEIGQMSTLRNFFCFDNPIDGSIPSEIGNTKFLTFTRMHNTRIGGTLPTEVGKLAQLRELWVSRNLMAFTIPSEIGMIPDMTDFRIHAQNVTGTLPITLFQLQFLKRFDAYDTFISGTIPTEIGLSSRLSEFRVRGSLLDGTLPTEIGAAVGMRSLWVHRTLISGSIPIEICRLRGSRGLVQLTADCKAETPDEDPKVLDPFRCATACCVHSVNSSSFECDNPAYGPTAVPDPNTPPPTPTPMPVQRTLNPATLRPSTAPMPVASTAAPITNAPFLLPPIHVPIVDEEERWTVLQSIISTNEIVSTSSSAELLGKPLSVLKGQAFNTTASPTKRAASWLILEDQKGRSGELPWRYALAVLYFSTGGPNWTRRGGWLSPAHVCEWQGVLCSWPFYFKSNWPALDRIVSLNLDSNNLTGESSLPEELNLLQDLVSLFLSNNALGGTLPALAIGSIPTLLYLYVNNNQFTGEISTDLGNNGRLHTLFVQENNFTGDFPLEFCAMPSGSILRLREFGLDCRLLRCFCCGGVNPTPCF